MAFGETGPAAGSVQPHGLIQKDVGETRALGGQGLYRLTVPADAGLGEDQVWAMLK